VARFAVVGGRTWGEMHLRALSQFEREGRGTLVGLADLDAALLETRRQQFGVDTWTDFRTMLDEARPDAVTIATPDHLHRAIALECLERGIHVLVEKPMDVTVEGCREMVACAERNNALLQVEFMKRKDPYHIDLERRIRQGQLGQVQYGYAWMEDRIEVPRDWLPGWASGSDPAWFLGVHLFDLVRWLVRADAVSVSATASKGKLAGLGIDTYDAVQSKVVFENGTSFAVDVAWHFPDGNEAIVNQGVKVVGTEGWLTVDSQYRGGRGCIAGPGAVGVGTEQGTSGAKMFTPNLGLFLEKQTRGGTPVYSGYGIESIQEFAYNVVDLLGGATISDLGDAFPRGVDGLEVTKMVVAAHRSIDLGGELVRLADL
jgi:predicted dehydrogenase